MPRVDRSQIRTHKTCNLRSREVWIGGSSCCVGCASKGQVGDRRERRDGNERALGKVSVFCDEQCKYKRQVASCGVPDDADPWNPRLFEATIARMHVAHGRGERVFRGETVVRDEGACPNFGRDMPDEVSVRSRRL